MSGRRTMGLAGLVVVLAIAAVLAQVRLAHARDAAVASRRDVDAVRDGLRDLAAWHVTGGDGDAASGAGGGDTDLGRRVRAAAAAAGTAERLVSVEPGPTVRVRDTPTAHTPVYVRLEGVTLGQAVTFLLGLTARDPAVRVTGVELAAPAPGAAASAAAGAGEAWDVDATLSQTSAAPGDGGRP